MTCKCGSDRIAHVQGKSKDLNTVEIPHLDFEHDGYMMDIGVGSGDYVEFSLCLDCGQVQGFTPVTDETIKESDEYTQQNGDGEETAFEATYKANRKPPEGRPDPNDKSTWYEKAICLKDIEKQRVVKLMQDAYGADWQKDAEAIDILHTTLDKPETGVALRDAIKELLT